MNEILRLRLRMDNRDTSANFAMQRHRKFLAEFRLRSLGITDNCVCHLEGSERPFRKLTP